MILIFTILCYLHGALSDTTQTFHSYKLETYIYGPRGLCTVNTKA